MDAAHWHQGLGLVKPMEEMLMAANPNPSPSPSPNQNPLPSASSASGSLRVGAPAASSGSTERRTRPQKEKSLNCPRCNSTNTKFCYYNNYSLQQPRYFCKTCRRYWTEGGSLRNVPVGGGSRKNKRSSSAAASTVAASSSAAVSGASLTSAAPAGAQAKNPKLGHEGARDLNLAFPHHGGLQPHEFAAFPSLESSSVCNPGAAMASNGGGREGGVVVGALSAMELLRSTGCYMPLPVPVPMGMPAEYAAAGFGLAEFRAQAPHAQGSLGFSLDVHGTGGGAGGYGATAGLHRVQEGAGRLLFPFEDLKPVVSSGGGASSGRDQFGHSKEQAGGGGSAGAHNTPGFWNGMIGGGGGDSSW